MLPAGRYSLRCCGSRGAGARCLCRELSFAVRHDRSFCSPLLFAWHPPLATDFASHPRLVAGRALSLWVTGRLSSTALA